MRIVFLGTPAWSVGPLRALVAAGHEVVMVVSQPDRKRGRGGGLLPSPVKAAALELGLPVTHRVKDAMAVAADLAVVVAFGRILKPEFLERFTTLNVHPSLLPRWRGATPIESAIAAGDHETGVCVMKLVEEMDAGPVYAVETVQIQPEETAQQLGDRLFQLGTALLLDVLSRPLPEPTEQQGEVTFARKIEAEDLHLDWTRPADQLDRVIRVGRAWTTFRDRRLIIVKAHVVTEPANKEPGTLNGTVVATGAGALQLVTVQPEGKAATSAKDWANGARLEPGEKLV